MYNDYYLQQIDNKMSTNNSLLDDIITNQETLISGDNEIISNQETIIHYGIIIQILLMTILLYLFVVRCMK